MTFIAKIEYLLPPKAEVLSYLGGGAMPERKAKFWWFKGNESPRVATQARVHSGRHRSAWLAHAARAVRRWR